MNNKIFALKPIALLALTINPIQAKNHACRRELAKAAADIAGSLQAGVYLCGKSSSVQVSASRIEIELKSQENYPYAKESFRPWYDEAYNQAMVK